MGYMCPHCGGIVSDFGVCFKCGAHVERKRKPNYWKWFALALLPVTLLLTCEINRDPVLDLYVAEASRINKFDSRSDTLRSLGVPDDDQVLSNVETVTWGNINHHLTIQFNDGQVTYVDAGTGQADSEILSYQRDWRDEWYAEHGAPSQPGVSSDSVLR